MKAFRFLAPVGVFAMLVVLLWRGLSLDPHEVPSPLIGKPAPDFSLVQLDDDRLSIRRDDMLGRVWMLNVWASWCVACRQEHATLVEFARAIETPIVGLDYKDTQPEGQAWLARFGNPYRVSGFDADGRVGIDFGVYGVPETFIIDKRGVVRFKQIGPLTPEVIRDRIRPLLKELDA